jgi:hypothetical protein
MPKPTDSLCVPVRTFDAALVESLDRVNEIRRREGRPPILADELASFRKPAEPSSR